MNKINSQELLDEVKVRLKSENIRFNLRPWWQQMFMKMLGMNPRWEKTFDKVLREQNKRTNV